MKKIMAIMGVTVFLAGNSFAQNKTISVTDFASTSSVNGKRHINVTSGIPNLTEEQKTEINKIVEEGRRKAEPQSKKMKTLRSNLNKLKMADNPDQQQINNLIDESEKTKAEMEKFKTALQLKVISILTPEQRKAVDTTQ